MPDRNAGPSREQERRNRSGVIMPMLPTMQAAPAPAQAAPVQAPVTDSAQQRAQQASQFFPEMFGGLRDRYMENTLGADVRMQNRVGALEGAMGATNRSADAFRNADTSEARLQQLLATMASPAQTPAQTPAGGNPAATDAPPAPLTSEQQYVQSLQALEGLELGVLERMSGFANAPQQQPPVKDTVMQTAFDMVMQDVMQGTRPDASVEESSAARQMAMQQLITLLGGNALTMPTMEP